MDRRSVTGWTRRHPDATDLTVAVAFGLLVLAGTLIQRDGQPDALLGAASLGLAVGALVLWSLRRRRDRSRRQAAALLEQRLGIARELHDVVAHHVSVIGIQAAAARRSLDRAPGEAAEALTAIETSSRAAVLEMQRLVTTLRHPDEDDGSGRLPSPPPPTLADLPRIVAPMRTAGLEVELVGFDAPDRPTLSAPAEVALYRVTQEALTNALRHAGAVAVRVSLEPAPGTAILRIDHGPATGRGATGPGATGTSSGGMGIPGMRERIRAVGGVLDAGPTADGGFAVTASVPLDPA